VTLVPVPASPRTQLCRDIRTHSEATKTTKPSGRVRAPNRSIGSRYPQGWRRSSRSMLFEAIVMPWTSFLPGFSRSPPRQSGAPKRQFLQEHECDALRPKVGDPAQPIARHAIDP
jgi:hypothetical protein